MRRKALDTLLTGGGLVVAIVLLVAGSLLMWGHNFADSNVHSQLAQQQISFPAKGSSALASAEIGPYLNQYAGKQLTTGPQAKAYADHFIAVHLSEMPYGGVYSKVSAASRAKPTTAKLAGLVTTVFRGTTLRSMLLEAYGFSVFGDLAFDGALAAFSAAGLLLILTALGLLHIRRVPEDLEFPKSIATTTVKAA